MSNSSDWFPDFPPFKLVFYVLGSTSGAGLQSLGSFSAWVCAVLLFADQERMRKWFPVFAVTGGVVFSLSAWWNLAFVVLYPQYSHATSGGATPEPCKLLIWAALFAVFVHSSHCAIDFLHILKMVSRVEVIQKQLAWGIIRYVIRGISPKPEDRAYSIELVEKFSAEASVPNAEEGGAERKEHRAIDLTGIRVYFCYARTYEVNGKLSNIRRFLLSRLRTATLRQDEEGQASLVNSLLRSYIQDNLYDQAEKLVGKLTYPEAVHNNQLARFQYYLGRIKATKLEYSEAQQHLLQASRKVPSNGAIGFKQTVQKWLVTVELLLGDIPERAIFLEKEYRKCLAPYYALTLAIRAGKLARFNEVLKTYAEQFKKDETYSLIVRLRHNVIKTGIRTINAAYSRISVADVAKKLQLDSVEDVYFILAKAISERVIEAQLLADSGTLVSKENVNIYSTKDPFVAFDKRIKFCLDTHDQSVKAMRFPAKSYHGDLETAEERREREQQEAELAKEIADEDDDILY